MQHNQHEPPIWRQATLVGMAFRATPEWVICIQLPASAPPGSRYTPCRSTPLLPPHLPSRPADQRLIPGVIRRGRGYGTAAALVLTIGPGQEFLIDEVPPQRRVVGVYGAEKQADSAFWVAHARLECLGDLVKQQAAP